MTTRNGELMTPAEHYAEAERLIGKVVEDDGTPPGERTAAGRVTHQPWVDSVIALAQVHATLAGLDRDLAYEAEHGFPPPEER